MKQNSDEGWWQVQILLEKAIKADCLDDVLALLLTLDEKEALIGRVQIVKGLLKGDASQREMADSLHVSIAKITRGSNSLKTIDEDFRRFLEKALD